MAVKDIQLLKPDFLINTRNIKHARNIYEIMRDQGITRSYAYGMLHRPTLLSYEFLKIGMSCPSLGEREHQVGERLVRQLSHFPGWPTEPKTSNGSDFWWNTERDLIKTGYLSPNFNKNNLEIAVWNVSSRMSTTDYLVEQEKNATQWVEGELANQHKMLYNKLPPLNYADPSTTQAYKGAHLSKEVFDNHFEFI